MKKLREWRSELKEYDTHLPSEDGEAFKPRTAKQLFNQLKLLQTGARALAQTKGATMDPTGRAISEIEAGLERLVNQLARIEDGQWDK